MVSPAARLNTDPESSSDDVETLVWREQFLSGDVEKEDLPNIQPFPEPPASVFINSASSPARAFALYVHDKRVPLEGLNNMRVDSSGMSEL